MSERRTQPRARPAAETALAPPPGGARGEGEPGVVLVVSEEPERFARLEVPGRIVRFWGGDDVPAAVRGDPADPATYAPVANGAHPITAVLDLRAPERALAALRALHEAAPDAAALVLCHHERIIPPDDMVARCVPAPALFGRELAASLSQVEADRRVRLLRRFAEGSRVLPVLVQSDPDPDALASALAVRAVLGRTPSTCPIVSLGELTRPENRRMADLLDIGVSTVGEGELLACDRVITVDVQPPELPPERAPRWAVIDHHPPEGDYDADFLDVRPGIGATATMLTEYVRAYDPRLLGDRLATALLYGIRTDTATLTRGVSPADADAYVFLQQRADPELLVRIERRASPPEIVRRYGEALAGLEQDGDLLVVDAGALEEESAHIVADLADFCLSAEGARWAAAAAETESGVTVALRHLGDEPGAGALARGLADSRGLGGGHRTMARWTVPTERVREVLGDTPAGRRAPVLLRILREAIDALA